MIGKGFRSHAVLDALKKFKAVYLAATDGAGALLPKRIKKSQVVVAYEDLGPKALFRLEVEEFPTMAVNDAFGGDLYSEGKAAYRKE